MPDGESNKQRGVPPFEWHCNQRKEKKNKKTVELAIFTSCMIGEGPAIGCRDRILLRDAPAAPLYNVEAREANQGRSSPVIVVTLEIVAHDEGYTS